MTQSATRPAEPRARARALLAALTALAFLSGCSSRTIIVTSEPPGAQVTLNGIEVGTTPLEVGFRYYGQYDLRLAKDGYEPIAAAPWAIAPWYEYPPIDFLLLPVPTSTKVRWHYDLAPASIEAASRDELIERADTMRRAIGTN
ncbi:MAG: PEGA domain-containing protein [Phycisphaeraceae bacterium]|nr:PEGA domain-containing protein [Phycisphaeraceae bacterium]